MELKVNEVVMPESIEFNYEELKTALTEKVEMYKTLVYTDKQISEAKADRADLNKLKKALNDERLRREREYMKPFEDFKKKINEIITIIDEPVAVIDKQIKGYEEKKKQEKKDEIQAFYDEELRDDLTTLPPDWLSLEMIFDNKWLNASARMKVVQDEIKDKVRGVLQDLATLSELPEFGFEAVEVYKSTLDINRALNEGRRLADIQKRKLEEEARKKEAEAQKAAEVPEPEKVAPTACQPADPVEVWKEEQPEAQWVTFTALLTAEKAKKLAAFFVENGISFKKA